MTKYTHIRDHPLLETSLFFTMSYCTFLAAEAAQMTGTCSQLVLGFLGYFRYFHEFLPFSFMSEFIEAVYTITISAGICISPPILGWGKGGVCSLVSGGR